MFTIFPAIDLRHGKVVRLEEGRDDRKTEYGDDPVAQAQSFVDAGAQALHVVDLDAAFRDGSNKEIVRKIVEKVDIPVQIGGGIRTTEMVAELLETGVKRVIIGSAAVSNPDWVAEVTEKWDEQIVVGIDAKDGEVKTHGWVEGSGKRVEELASAMSKRGVKRVVYTDIANDGMLTGPDSEGSARLAKAADIEVVISGGVGTIEHVKTAAQIAKDEERVVGIIIGKAIYDGRVSLKEALEVAQC
jgi:phosphoribosylformimino-5-aminoimidazole carboxamide ribotide isomerase